MHKLSISMAYDSTLREESLKLKVAADWFAKFDCTDIIGRIDFAVKMPNKKGTSLFGDEYLLWAEAKQQPTDIIRMLAQLLITIKQDASNQIPPRFVGCFDCEKIAFVEYAHILPIFNVNDFDWTQTPSAVNDKTVETVAKTIDTNKIYTFYFDHDPKEIIEFIKNNFVLNNSNVLSTQIDRNNFIFIYQKWRQMVMPYIEADWALLKKNYSLYDRDFFLAELNIDDNGTTDLTDDKSINNNFYITFEANASKPYSLSRKDALGLDVEYRFVFKKGGLDHYADFGNDINDHRKKPFGNTLPNVSICLYHKTCASAKEPFSHHKFGSKNRSNTLPMCLAPIGKRNIMCGIVVQVLATC